MRIRLYINDQLADLGSASESLILWTYTREDTEAPAAVKNSYTKTVTLPGTEANNKIFGHIYRPDHVSTFSDFDPLSRTPFVCIGDDGDIMERGYLKLDMIQRAGSMVVSYEVTLYGGLGGFLYGLTYKADGSKKTLADLRWPLAYNATEASDISLMDNIGVSVAWNALINGDTWMESVFGLINFAPCQNGIPSGSFDADKAYYIPGSQSNQRYTGVEVPYTDPDSGTVYNPSTDDPDGGVLISLGNKLTEWEAQDLRESLQRPVFNIHRFLYALTFQVNTGDWKFVLNNEGFFDVSTAYVGRGWITLPYPNTTVYAHDEFRFLTEYLSVSLTPADYLLGLAKTFGLVFVVDKTTRTITLMSRDAYYSEANNGTATAINLDDRIDTTTPPEMRPYVMDARYYNYQHPPLGAFCEYYRERYGREYGSFRLDTSYSFDAAEVDVMKSVPFKGAADVSETSGWYFVQEGGPDGLVTLKYYRYGDCSYTLYNGTQSKKITVDPPGRRKSVFWKTGALAFPQFHDSTGKQLDGAGVLLFYTGSVGLPAQAGPNNTPIRWRLTTRTHGMDQLNNGRECWNLTLTQDGTVLNITRVPHFLRWIEWPGQPGFQDATHMMDFGDPEENAWPSNPGGGIYARRWDRYMADRFNRDTVVMTVMVNLAGLRVDESLLRRFFWYDGCYWSLNKIIDYNPSGYGPTQCELVRIQNPQDYTNGQTY